MKTKKSSGRVDSVRRSRKPAMTTPVQCDSLIAAIKGIERALEACGGEQKPSRRFINQLSQAAESLREHIRLTEGPDGLITGIDEHHPRLGRWAQQLRDDHAHLWRQLNQIHYALAKFGVSAGPKSFARVCARCSQLVAALKAHQEKGTELLFQAYVADMGLKG